MRNLKAFVFLYLLVLPCSRKTNILSQIISNYSTNDHELETHLKLKNIFKRNPQDYYLHRLLKNT
jgi:hypothetical protein